MRAHTQAGRAGRLDLFDGAVLLLLGALSAWLLVLLWARSRPTRVWTGTDGPFVGDQFQYLGWIRESARHVLVGDPFQVASSPRLFLHPGLVLSGLAVRAGLSPSAALLLWQPVAVVALFAAVRSYTRRMVPGLGARRVALVLALFPLAPLAAAAPHLGWLSVRDILGVRAIGTDMWPILSLWGYPFTALAVAAMATALLLYGRDRGASRTRPWAALAGFLCAWLQPWQGATLLLVVAVAEVTTDRRHDDPSTRRRSRRRATLFAAATAVPLLYYGTLPHLSTAWATANSANQISFPWWDLVLALFPAGLVAAAAYRRGSVRTFQDLALRLWPPASLAVYLGISLGHIGTFPLHALQGLSIPLAVLCVDAFRRPAFRHRPLLWRPSLALLAVVAAGALALELDGSLAVGQPTFGSRTAFYLRPSEVAALDDLARDPRPGAVLAPVLLGQTVPAETGRHTWVGLASWTPHEPAREAAADALFSGRLDARSARRLVAASGVRFLLADCGHPRSLSGLLGPEVTNRRRFGCATLYTVRSGDTVRSGETVRSGS